MEELKALGNAEFSKGNYKEADDYYAAALLLVLENEKALPNDYATLHGNRSAALLKQGRAAAALEEAENAVRRNPYWSKGHFRKAEALKALNRWKDAASSFTEAFRLSPTETGLKSQIQTATARAKVEEEKPALQRLQEHIKATGTISNLPVTPLYSQFIIEEELGLGNYSQVFKAKFLPTNEIFALKVIDKKKAERLSVRHGNLKGELRAERRILTRLNHCNIVKLFHTFQDINNIYYVEEFCAGKELWFQLKVTPPSCLRKEWPSDSKLWGLCGLKPTEAKFYLAQILNALDYLHSQGIVHRDLKPENVMISTENGGDCVKLIDFGTARDLLDWEDDKIADEDKDEGDDDRALSKGRKKTHFIGTAEFMSPEAIHGRPADHRSDLWSYGCTAFQLFSGRTPFKGASDYLTFLKADAASYSLPKHYENSAEEKMLKKLLKVDAKERISSAKELKKDPYFYGVNFDLLQDSKNVPKLPTPTLLEMCIEKIGTAIWIEAESWGEGPVTKGNRINNKLPSKRRRFEGEEIRQQIGLDKLHEKLNKKCKDLIRGWLEQRSVMNSPTSIRLLYGPNTRQAPRIVDHSFVGFSQQEEGTYAEPYLIAVVDLPENNDELDLNAAENIFKKLNDSSPTPSLVLLVGENPKDEFFQMIRSDISVASINKSISYYSFWIGGILYIVLDAPNLLNSEEQKSWLERELMVGKLCARYVIVISTMKWINKSYEKAEDAIAIDEKDENLIDISLQTRYLKDMQESCVQVILHVGSGSKKGMKYTILKASPNEPTVSQISTTPFPERVQIVRLLPTDVIYDSYQVNELTGYFHLEKGELPEQDDENIDSSDEE